MPTNHAILSPSSSHRWLNCSAAPLLEQSVPDQTSEFAEEGTLAHAICEAKLQELNCESKQSAEDLYLEAHGHAWTEHTLYNPDMEDSSERYRDIVASYLVEARNTTPDATLIIEQPLDLTKWIPEGFGTSDAIIVADGTMNVIDYKNGKGVEVSAEHNPQMMIYALGALNALSYAYNIEKVMMTIVQPRIGNISTWSITAKKLLKWADEELKPKALLAWRGAREEVDVEQHPGEWCRFCKVKARCRALAELSEETTSHNITDKLLTPEEVANYLPKVASIKSWCSELESYALAQALNGDEIPGYKIVEGRSVRSVSDPAALASVLEENGYVREAIFKPQELQTITALEAIVGKKKFGELAKPYIMKPQGKPTLVPESDKRPPMNSIMADFEHAFKK